MMGFGVEGGGCYGHNGADNANGVRIFLFDRRVLDAAAFKLTGEASVQSGVGLGIWRLSRIGEAIQEVGRHNRPPRLRNRLFTKSVEVIG